MAASTPFARLHGTERTPLERRFLADMGLALRRLRDQTSQVGLSAVMSLDHVTQWRRESGRVDWPVSQLVTYCAVMGVHPAELLAAAMADFWPLGQAAPDAAYATDAEPVGVEGASNAR
jgi:hypothetical protein